ncbi:Hypothetical predicted protein [Mytilus galloprovincialis]|uniref:B box-type domain-containing protein n=1 Tax=Mytilus galloprovincialis TaxID=29158 RepID=A0A8B6FE84_MYTGA|nr:Hypothetical predicted protein [Mytilus galloprovincialis]
MEFTKSVHRSQVPVACQLCELDNKIQWKCKQCNLLMCNKCKDKIHPKFQNAQDHDIFNIKDVGKAYDVKENLEFNKIKCDLHAGQTCCLFCSTCQNLVCPTCISKAHNGHNFLDITDAYTRKKEKIEIIQMQADKKIQKILDMEKELQRIKTSEESKYNKAKQAISLHKVSLKTSIDLHADLLETQLEENRNSIQKAIETEQARTTVIKEKICHQKLLCTRNITESQSLEKVFRGMDQLENTIQQDFEPFNMKFESTPVFFPRRIISIGALLEYTFANVANEQESFKIKLEINRKFETSLKHIHNLHIGKDAIIWINDRILKKVQKIVLKENHVEIISSFDIDINAIGGTIYNDLLITSGLTYLLFLNEKTGQDRSKYNIAPLLTLVVCITDQYVFIAGMSPTVTNPSSAGRRVVVKFNHEATIRKDYELDENNKPLFIYPRGITCTSNENIFVMDWLTEDNEGQIVVLGKEGKIITYYKGNPSVNSPENPFKPTYIASSPVDLVFITDMLNQTLHVLSNDGHLLTHINTSKYGILYPACVGFSASGKLFVGCASSSANIAEKGKLYELTISCQYIRK